jgi:sec-independent protein translocase protein TatB
MEILGIGPGEFVVILIVLLVVVGPERLPGLARQTGQFLVRARNWLQTSPDAALVMRARAEIEAELASIKNSLLEVQVVRDEVMGAAKQLGDSVNSIAPPKLDLNSLVNPPAETTIAANGQAISGEAPGLLLPDGTPAAGTPLDQLSTIELPNGSSVPITAPAETQHTNGYNGAAVPASTAASAAPALGELESINIRLQAIMADMWALQQQLKQRGALDDAWQPPSLDVQLPTPATAVPAEPASEAEPVEDPAVLAARKLLAELTPIRVAYHAPPVIEPTPDDSAPEAALATDTDTTKEVAALPALIDPTAPAAQPVAKTRKRRAAAIPIVPEVAETPANDTAAAKACKRRAAATAEAIEEIAEALADDKQATKTRKRRTPAGPESSGEIEPVTTEKAS